MGQARAARRSSPVPRLKSSGEWISRNGPRARRKTTFAFNLSKPSLVEFVIVRVAPDCRRIGSFRVRGHAGLNKVQFRGRFRGRPLAEGTYEIRARAVRGRRVAQATVVIFDHRPTAGEVAAAKASNACSSSASESFGGGSAGAGSDQTTAPAGSTESGSKSSTSGGGGDRAGGRDEGGSGVLGVRFSRAADAVSEVHPLLFVILGLSIMLLALAALPRSWVPNARVAAVLAYRRSLVALAGATALVVVAVAYALA